MVDAAMQYLDYCESVCRPPRTRRNNWDVPSNQQLSPQEMATKNAALHMINTWMLGDLPLPVTGEEQLPPRVVAALSFLSHCRCGDDLRHLFSWLDFSDHEPRNLDATERCVKSTALELLRNWFNGELELQPSVEKRVKINKRPSRYKSDQSSYRRSREK